VVSVTYFRSLGYSVIFWVGQSTWGCAGLYSWGWLGEIHMVNGVHLLVLSNDVQAGLEVVAAVALAMVVEVAAVRNDSKFSHCNVLWGSFPHARGSGCLRFDSGWCFIST
jgi:hypothetical protein